MNDISDVQPDRRIDVATLPMSLDEMVAQQTGVMTGEVKTNMCMDTPEGRSALLRHMQFSPPENEKINGGWYAREFNLVSYSCRATAAKRSPDGELYDRPRPLVRTVLEGDDGFMMVSSSPYVYQSLMQIISLRGQPSADNPIRVMLGRGGNADKLICVETTKKEVVKSRKG